MSQAPELVVEQKQQTHIRNNRPQRTYVVVALVLAGALALVALFLVAQQWMHASAHEDTSNAIVESNVYQISPVIPGVVSEVLVEESQAVKKDQVIVRLDAKQLRLQERQAAAALQMSRQQAEAARMQIVQINEAARSSVAQIAQNAGKMDEALAAGQKDLASLKTEQDKAADALRQTREQFAHINNQYQNLMVLTNNGYTNHEMIRQAQAVIQSAKAKVDAAANKVQSLQAKADEIKKLMAQIKAAKNAPRPSQSGMLDAQLAGARQQYAAALSGVKQAELGVEQARLASYYASITSPIDGVVARKAIQVGQQVQPGQPIVAIVQPGAWVTANFDEKQIARIQPGQRAAIKVPTMPNTVVWGRVKTIAPIAFAQPAETTAPKNLPKNRTQPAHKQNEAKAAPVVAAAAPAVAPDPAAAPNVAPVPVPPSAKRPSTGAQQPQHSAKMVRTVPVKIEFESDSLKTAQRAILPGMSASVSVRVR